MATETNLAGFSLPKLANIGIGMTGSGATSPEYSDIIKQIQKAGDVPTITQSVLPSIASILSPEGQGVSPYAQSIKRQTQENVSGVQTAMQKRGLTGSSIEAGEMGRAQAAGEYNLAQLYGQTANQLSQMIYQAAVGDLNTNRELILTLAQAMGQELTSQRDMQMFRQALQASLDEASAMRTMQTKAMWVGAGSQLLGSVAKAGSTAYAAKQGGG